MEKKNSPEEIDYKIQNDQLVVYLKEKEANKPKRENNTSMNINKDVLKELKILIIEDDSFETYNDALLKLMKFWKRTKKIFTEIRE